MTVTFNPISHQLWQRFNGWIFRDHIDQYIAEMQSAGYRPRSICRAVRTVGDYARWLIDEHHDGSDVSLETIRRFLSRREEIRRVQNGDRSAVLRFFKGLKPKGDARISPATDPHERILTAFSDYLRQKRGLHPSTIKASVYDARPFFRDIWGGVGDLGEISRQDVVRYVEGHVHDHSVSTTHLHARGLRCSPTLDVDCRFKVIQVSVSRGSSPRSKSPQQI